MDELQAWGLVTVRSIVKIAVLTVLLLVNCLCIGSVLLVTRGVPSNDQLYVCPLTEELLNVTSEGEHWVSYSIEKSASTKGCTRMGTINVSRQVWTLVATSCTFNVVSFRVKF